MLKLNIQQVFKMDEQEKAQQNNMISNLPLLFANGYPTSLDKITESQLENFIPFMVQCSLGHINMPGKVDYSEPEWWPEDLPFTIPFTKPRKLIGNWMERMKEIVVICYQFHKSVFLLRFCNDLASYEQASLRFINNYNSTTSLYDRRNNKLLVTFRNENMSYDQQQRSRKCLLQQKNKSGSHDSFGMQQMMVEPAPFDIYLCDNCDAELYSNEAIMEHEKTCNVEDDVILCDSPEPQNGPENTNTEDNELRIGFLLNFNLQSRDSQKQPNTSNPNQRVVSQKVELSAGSSERNKRLSRRNRTVHSLNRCPTIPLSSPAGQQLLRSTKMVTTLEYLSERLERVERFCQAPLLLKSSSKPKFFDKRTTTNNIHCTFKKPPGHSSHMYVFPRRQYSQRRCTTENFLFLNSPLIKRCRPISVRLKKITDSEVSYGRSSTNGKLNIKLTRDTARRSNWKISSPSNEIIVDTIDLCSSDEEEYSNSTLLPITNSSTELQSKTPIILSSSVCNVEFTKSRCKTNSTELNCEDTQPLTYTTHTHNTNMNNCSVNNNRVNFSSSYIKILSSSTSNSKHSSERKSYDSHFDNNVLRSTSSSLIDKTITTTNPMRQSVYIFSNYKERYTVDSIPCNSVTALDTRDINTLTANEESASAYNEENCLAPASDWYGSARNIVTNAHNNVGQNRTMDCESLSIIQPFNSPGRVISIDLTT